MIDTDKYEGHTRGPWKSIPYCKSIRDKLLHGGIILASSGIGDGSNYSPFIITDDDVVIWPKDTDGKNVVEYEHGAKGPILHIYYEEMMANTRLTMAAPDLLAEVKRLQKRNEWLEEVVAQAQEHYHIDLSDEGWPRWEVEE